MTEQWLTVDEGWGRRAVDFATLLEPSACREYVAMHQHLDVGEGDRLLDIACGSGLALELARLRGATVSGIDASARLVEVARDRLPGADVRVGDMAALPWADHSFDVVTSFRGLWATTREALGEARRVLRPGGRFSLTTWGHVKASPGVWALSPFTLAADHRVRAQADMKSLGRQGVGEDILAEAGFVDVHRHSVPFAWEFPDPEAFAPMLASTGPGYEAIQAVGEEQFHRYCIEVATTRAREGLPLRAEIDCVGLTARVPRRPSGSLLGEPPSSVAASALAEEDLADLGFVANVTKLWMHDPPAFDELFTLITSTARSAGLSLVDRGVATIVAAALTRDSYCPLAWGGKVAEEAGPELAASLVSGSDELLDERGRAIAAWARLIATEPRSAGAEDLENLLRAGFDRAQILRLTLFITMRIAFATVNGALAAPPEQEYVDLVHPRVREAWQAAFGRIGRAERTPR
jgi:SAM-dependent methyltransferase/alkylhydroperoxidase family enzyme